MQTETNFAAYVSGTESDPLKSSILAALRRFARQRPGLEYGNYGDPVAYRSEMRGITRDLKEAETLLRQVELVPSITGRDLITASRLSFSGRLKITETPDGVTIDYTTGQYFPTEYRRAVAAICAGALWEWVRAKAMPTPLYRVDWKNERGAWVPSGKVYHDRDAAEWAAKITREQLQRQALTAFDTPPPCYGETMVVERYAAQGEGYMSAGDWLRRYFRREFGRGIASRFFN